jgi:hypothetical protein
VALAADGLVDFLDLRLVFSAQVPVMLERVESVELLLFCHDILRNYWVNLRSLWERLDLGGSRQW